MSARLLLVDDDRFLLDNVKRLLAAQGYQVRTASSAEDAFSKVAEEPPDLMVLDVGLPDSDGVSLCRRIRAKWRFPVIMLTARSDAIDKVIGLEVGADDYLTKPFEPAELVARVRALLRRSQEYQAAAETSPGSTSVGELVIDHDSRQALVAGTPVSLTNKEFELLALLAKNAGRVLTRETLFETVWGYEMDFNSNSLDVYMYRLRKKIESDPENPRFLHTLKGYGYRLGIDGA
jgi:DNA-binding response OmpR family regulator